MADTLFCIESLHRGEWSLRSETFTTAAAAEAWVARTFGDARRAVRIVEVPKRAAFYTIIDANAPHYTKAVVEADTKAEALIWGLKRFGHVLVHETPPDLIPGFSR